MSSCYAALPPTPYAACRRAYVIRCRHRCAAAARRHGAPPTDTRLRAGDKRRAIEARSRSSMLRLRERMQRAQYVSISAARAALREAAQ